MRPNPPIKGHELIAEGRNGWSQVQGWSGGCRCGEHPGAVMSASAMREWHRQHKADLRLQAVRSYEARWQT